MPRPWLPSGLTRTGSSTSRAALARCSNLFDADAIEVSTLGSTAGRARRGLYAPAHRARDSNHIHVWKSLLEQRRLQLSPTFRSEWEAVLVLLVRPGAAGGASGDWAATTSGPSACRCRPRLIDTDDELFQFQLAYEAPCAEPRSPAQDRRSRSPAEAWSRRSTPIRRSSARAAHRPNSVTGPTVDNNKAFLAQTVVMTPNGTLSIPAALQARPARTTTTRTPRPSTGRCGATASRSPSSVSSRAPWSSRLAATSRLAERVRPLPRARRAGSPIGSTSRAIVCCRRCRS